MSEIFLKHSTLFSISISCRCFVPSFVGSHLLTRNKPFRFRCVSFRAINSVVVPLTNDHKLPEPVFFVGQKARISTLYRCSIPYLHSLLNSSLAQLFLCVNGALGCTPTRMISSLSSRQIGYYILLKLLLVGLSTARPSPMSSSYFYLISPVRAIDFSSLIIFFTLIFSLSWKWRVRPNFVLRHPYLAFFRFGSSLFLEIETDGKKNVVVTCIFFIHH